MRPLALAVILLLGGLPASDLAAEVSVQESDRLIEIQTKRLAAEIRCPVCRGASIEESPSAFAGEMKAVIREKVVAGESRDDIRAYFADRYGEWVLLDPEPSGIMLTLWILPIGALALGALVLLVNARRWLRQPHHQEQRAVARPPRHAAVGEDIQ